MSKPSERIEEIYKKLKGESLPMHDPIDILVKYIDAIKDYLDEEYKNGRLGCECHKCPNSKSLEDK